MNIDINNFIYIGIDIKIKIIINTNIINNTEYH